MHDLENSKSPPSPVAGPETELPTPSKDSGLSQRPRSTSFYRTENEEGRLRKLVDPGKLDPSRRGEFTVDSYQVLFI